MFLLVSGGAGSGKSEYAEQLLLQYGAGQNYYLATMEVWDEEDRARVARHRALRKGKGFLTLEVPRNLDRVALPRGSSALLECLSNLCANECFGEQGFPGACERILRGIRHLLSQTETLVVVTNELFSDGCEYAPETMEYLDILSRLNCELARQADRVYEVVCGLPVQWKGERA